MRRQYAHEQPDADEIDLYEKLLSRDLLWGMSSYCQRPQVFLDGTEVRVCYVAWSIRTLQSLWMEG